MIYLDNAATTFPKPETVYQTVDRIQRTTAVNAGRGSYSKARQASDLLTAVREKVARMVDSECPEHVVLTPSATLAMNQIIHGLHWLPRANVYVSPFEHNAVVRPLQQAAEKYGFEILILPFDGNTQGLNEIEMQNMFALHHPDAVFVNHVSNVTGAILPIKTIFEAAKRYNAVTVLDASQSLGLIECSVHKIPIDFLVFAGHKNLYGHIGIGGFVQCGNQKLLPFLAGGTGSNSLNAAMPDEMPYRYEPGSYNILAVASLNAALDWANELGRTAIYDHKRSMTQYLIEGLKKNKSIKLYLPQNEENHIATVSFTHIEYAPNEVAEILDLDFDIAVRSGYHCAPYIHELIGTKRKGGTVRVSTGFFNTKDDIDHLLKAIKSL